MKPWEYYQLYLFDFDGVLVDTESLHLKAYQRMCSQRGFTLPWDQHEYAKVALFQASGLKQALYTMFPELYLQEPSWEVLYQEKRRCYLELLEEQGTQLMPGVADVLTKLTAACVRSCVVTHSPGEQIEQIKAQHPELSMITHWVTRECYEHPKPHPDAYQTALALYAQPQDRVIGFEDSPRGMLALSQTRACPYLVTSFLSHEQVEDLAQQVPQPFTHIRSFEDLSTQLVADTALKEELLR